MIIRPELKSDFSSIYDLVAAAFGQQGESKLIDLLRETAKPFISLVAELDQNIVGHILFTPVTLTGHPDLKIMGLAPLAVTPEHQKQGIGTALMNAGIVECEKIGAGTIVVLGHPEYYTRFGFETSIKYNIGCEYPVPPEAFMIRELTPGFLAGKSGTIQYHKAFKSLG